MAVRDLKPGNAVLVAAPLCLTRGEGDEISACLCDYPAFVRTPQDAAVPLVISVEGKQNLLSLLGSEAAAWHPFCRILGILRQGSLGLRVEVLQVELAVPIPDGRRYSHKATWDEALIEETTSFDYESREAEWAQKELADYQSGKLFRSLGNLTNVHLLTPVETDREELLARCIALAGSGSSSAYRALTRKTGSPFEGMDAFWCSIAALLPSWKSQFPLDSNKVSALLIAFDKAYGHEWQSVAADPALVGAIRYSPAVMATARTRIAGLMV
jgi:hypothetical protein